ncbi:MAG TPA: FG-GAP-like repeat-containing protein, partial [Panacibacter sp.]|nr:FG-GAP-like repeat-containing protein [Panacibacter sp.]
MNAQNRNPDDLITNHHVNKKMQQFLSGKSLHKFLMLAGTAFCVFGLQAYSQKSCYTFHTNAKNNPLKNFIVKSASESRPFFADIDGDGDLDCFAGEYTGSANAGIAFYRNIGNNSQPKFEQVISNNPLASVTVGTISLPYLIDIDDDNDFDCFIGDGKFGALVFYQNTGTPKNAVFEKQSAGFNPLRMVKLSTTDQAEPAFADIDGDGDYDCLITDLYGDEYFYKNIGSAKEPLFEKMTGKDDPFSFLKDFEATGVSFYDWNKDGLTDLFIGTKYYQNYGSKSAPLFIRNNNEAPEFGTKNDLYPIRWADLNSDGFIDAVAGTPTGKFAYFTTAPEVSITPDQQQAIAVGRNITLTVYPQGKEFAYQWMKDGNIISSAVNTNLVASKAGNYSVRVTNTCGSSSSDEVAITSSNGTSLSVSAEDAIANNTDKFQVYPNPA